LAVPKQIRLANVGGICTELKRLYRCAWAGEITWQDAGSAARVLRELRVCLEGSEIEARIEALEHLLAEHRPGRANGHGHGHAERVL
jgi:hypothetical protein